MASGLCVPGEPCPVVDAIPICTTLFVCQFLIVFGWGQARSPSISPSYAASSSTTSSSSAAASTGTSAPVRVHLLRRQLLPLLLRLDL